MNTDTLESFRIIRDGDTPLRFRGHLIGSAKETSDVNSVVHEVELYRTASGKFIAFVYFDAVFLKRAERKAERFDTAAEVIAWLRDPESGQLPSVMQDALSRAARHDEEVMAAYGEEVP